MVFYKCLRCGFSNKSKTHFMNHLNRKFPCKPKLNDIPIEDIRALFFKKQNEADDEDDDEVAQNCTVVHTKLKKLHKKTLKCTVGIDTGAKFACEFCKKTFTRNSSRLRHLKTCKKKHK